MKHSYYWLAVAGCSLLGSGTVYGQDWRPFKPGLIHSFQAAGSPGVMTMRLDSAYKSGADSVYVFNRIMRPQSGSIGSYAGFRKTRNNQLGARVVVKATPYEYLLESVAEGTLPAQSLLLRPRAAVGSTWAASTSPALTATLTARGVQTIDGVTDSVATISLSNGRVLALSRANGLVRGPQWLNLTGATAPTELTLARRPLPFSASPNYPATVFDFQPGDEFGYEDYNRNATVSCYSSYTLWRILTRSQTADSLIYTYQEQSKTVRLTAPMCGTGGTSVSPIEQKRIAVSLRTGQWVSSYPSRAYQALNLLTFEALLVSALPNSSAYTVALPIRSRSAYSQCATGTLSAMTVWGNDAQGYSEIIDVNTNQTYMQGLGQVVLVDKELVYYRKLQPNGTYLTCGSNASFSTLLPSRAAQAAASFSVYPNPAAEQLTVALAQPAAPGTQLTVLDALGRRVRHEPLTAGQYKHTVALTGLPAGLYVVQLQQPGEAAVSVRLQHQ